MLHGPLIVGTTSDDNFNVPLSISSSTADRQANSTLITRSTKELLLASRGIVRWRAFNEQPSQFLVHRGSRIVHSIVASHHLGWTISVKANQLDRTLQCRWGE